MMVVFVSQCEKKALTRTRRVLDAFANRIGDNTWQTMITQEGLFAVKKLLCKTASKNTAVSCHWIKSRSRTELVWMVGNQNKFNTQGIVPVNYTSEEVIMDKHPIETSNLLANTRSQVLSGHLFSVGFVAYQLLDALHIKNERLKQSVFIAGILHDLGKIDPAFQSWVNKKIKKVPEDFVPEDGVHIDAPAKFSFDKHPRHHELSWILAEALLDGCSLNLSQQNQIAHGIYWHHTKPFRREKDDIFKKPEAIYAVFKKSLTSEKFEEIYSKAIAVIKDITSLAEKFEIQSLLPEINKSFSLKVDSYPDYKRYDGWADEIKEYRDNVSENALNNLVRSAVISADRLVSRCSAEDLEQYLSEGSLAELVDRKVAQEKTLLKTAIEHCLKSFEMAYPNSIRNQKQSEVSNSLADLKEIATINGAAKRVSGKIMPPASPTPEQYLIITCSNS